jgi:uncharacterized protein involved in oxidation of intracellular sulfur
MHTFSIRIHSKEKGKMPDNLPEVKKKFLFIVNDSPYGIERPYNALRLAMNLAKKTDTSISVFLLGDGVLCARKGQNTPEGYYNIERMIQSLMRKGLVSTCGTCCDARGLKQEDRIEGTTRGTMDILGEWTSASDQVLVF